MNFIALLFILGIVLLTAEVLTPGAILGILGALSMLTGCVLSFTEFGMGGGLLATVIALTLLGLALWVEFVILPRTKMGKRMFVHAQVDSTSQAPIGSDALFGHEGEALTTLAPSGYVQVDGRRYEAFSSSGHLEKGSRIRVDSRDNFRLLVSKV